MISKLGDNPRGGTIIYFEKGGNTLQSACLVFLQKQIK